MKTLTVQKLRDMLAGAKPDAEVRVWLPGSRIALDHVFTLEGVPGVFIEGNVEPGSALDSEKED